MNLAKKIATVAVLVLALNCLLMAGGLGWLLMSGALSKEKIAEYRKIAFPVPAPTTKPVEPVDAAAAAPMMSFDKILEATAGKSAVDQLQYMKDAFDQQLAILARQRQELLDLKRELDMASAKLVKDREAEDAHEKTFATREKTFNDKVVDEGFTHTLKIYNALDPKQVKDLFASMDDATVVRYLRAMDTRRVKSILTEFKTPEELSRAQTLLDQISKFGVPDAEAKKGTPLSTPSNQGP